MKKWQIEAAQSQANQEKARVYLYSAGSAIAWSTFPPYDADILGWVDPVPEKKCPWKADFNATICPEHGGIMAECPLPTNIVGTADTISSVGVPCAISGPFGDDRFTVATVPDLSPDDAPGKLGEN